MNLTPSCLGKKMSLLCQSFKKLMIQKNRCYALKNKFYIYIHTHTPSQNLIEAQKIKPCTGSTRKLEL